jgi:hypothetical protein
MCTLRKVGADHEIKGKKARANHVIRHCKVTAGIDPVKTIPGTRKTAVCRLHEEQENELHSIGHIHDKSG